MPAGRGKKQMVSKTSGIASDRGNADDDHSYVQERGRSDGKGGFANGTNISCQDQERCLPCFLFSSWLSAGLLSDCT